MERDRPAVNRLGRRGAASDIGHPLHRLLGCGLQSRAGCGCDPGDGARAFGRRATRYFTCATRIAKLDQICEIGGGFGAPARLFLTNGYRRPRSYVIADLPESLFFAECFLRATLGNDRVRYVGAAMDALPEGTAVNAIACRLTWSGCSTPSIRPARPAEHRQQRRCGEGSRREASREFAERDI